MKILISCLFAASALACSAQSTTATLTRAGISKDQRLLFLDGKIPASVDMCHRAILDSAKDPDSIKFLAKEYRYGKAFTKNWIFFTFEVMGRNTYGAVLRHTMDCTVACDPDKDSCRVVTVKDAS